MRVIKKQISYLREKISNIQEKLKYLNKTLLSEKNRPE